VELVQVRAAADVGRLQRQGLVAQEAARGGPIRLAALHAGDQREDHALLVVHVREHLAGEALQHRGRALQRRLVRPGHGQGLVQQRGQARQLRAQAHMVRGGQVGTEVGQRRVPPGGNARIGSQGESRHLEGPFRPCAGLSSSCWHTRKARTLS